MNASLIGVVGDVALADQLSRVLDSSIETDPDPVTAAGKSMGAFIALVVDSPDHPAFLADIAHAMVAHGVRVVVFDCPGGQLTTLDGAAHITRATDVNLAVVLSSAGLSTPESVKAAALKLPAWGGSTQPVTHNSPPEQTEPVTYHPEPVAYEPEPEAVVYEPAPAAPEPEPVAFEPEPEPVTYEPAPTAPEQVSYHPEPVVYTPEPEPDVYTPEPEPVTPEPVQARPPRRTMSESFAPNPAKDSPVLFVLGAKGGIQKTTLSTNISQAAGRAGIKTTLIDANRGQADVGTFLRIHRAAPTIFNLATGADYEAVSLSPSTVNSSYRSHVLDNILFKVVLGPNEGTSDSAVVTSRVYKNAITRAHEESDLVVVDTQIMEDSDNSALFDTVFLPTLARQNIPSWALFLTDPSPASLDNMFLRVSSMIDDHGIDPARILIALTNMSEKDTKIDDLLRESVDKGELRGIYIGSVPVDETVRGQQRVGQLFDQSPTVSPVISAVLSHVAGLQIEPTHAERKPRRTWKVFGR